MSKWSYTKGLHDLGNSVYAYLQPDGTWGWSNAGLITDGEASLLVDPLFDLKLTQTMLHPMRNSVQSPACRVMLPGVIWVHGGASVIWAGTTRNWLRACDRILTMDVETIVPGHGPITDKKGVAGVKGYFEYIFEEARKRYEAGMPAFEAARDIPLDRYMSWTDGERIAVNVASIYRELSGDQTPPDLVSLLGQMGALLPP